METIASGLMGAVLPKLTEMLTDEYKLLKGAKEGIRYIRDELESMQPVLEKVSEVPPDELDKQVNVWVRKVREMSYRIEDTVDSFMVHVDDDAETECGSCTTCCASIRSMLPLNIRSMLREYQVRGGIAEEIELIKKEVEEVSERRKRYEIDGIIMARGAPSDPRDRALYEDEAMLVGIDRSSKEIIKLLSIKEGKGASEQKLKVVSIVGPGGIGKTTLANAVYKKLEGKFDCTAFVSVSLQPDVNGILSEILRQVTSSKKDNPEDTSLLHQESQRHYGNTERWSRKEVIDKIRHVFQKKRYLILIDDIWDEGPWKDIACVLFENNLGSKVITTTRNIAVARLCCSSDKVDGKGTIHELQPLSDDDSEQLLYYKIFRKDGRCPTELRYVAKKILEKCKGWPLAIVSIASLLATKPTETEEWNSVYNSVSTGLENNSGVKDMRSILSLSYRAMPSHLRACLLYLSLFPEDHIIGKDDLIRRWIAEDLLVHERQNCSPYELGDKYFNELINMSIIQPIDVDAFGRAQACKVHDLVLEFIVFLAAEEDFVTILNGQRPFPPRPENIHRLSLRNSTGEHGIPQATRRLPHVRTLIVSSRAIDAMPSLSIFPVLRILELELGDTLDIIKDVENLVHLRYLRLRQVYHYYYDSVCIELPKGIGNLRFLQTLDLKEARIQELPSTVVQLEQLRVLEISLRKWDNNTGWEENLLRFLRNARQLEALCIFAPYISLDFMFQVDPAPRNLRRFIASPHDWSELHRVRCRRGSAWTESSSFSTLPGWINSSLSSLSDLSIMVKALRQKDLDVLAVLLVLRSLDLEVVEATRTRLEINRRVGGTTAATAFRCLGDFKFSSRAVGLVFRPGAMQKLQKLYLCFDVAETEDVHGGFDLGLENLTSLKNVNVQIDCRCARLREVYAAEAAFRNATNLNPNHPTIVLQRHYQDEMLNDRDEEISEDLQANTKDPLLSRVGPFGGKGGRARDIRVAPHRLERLTIRSGDVVDSLEFTYTDHNGQQRSSGRWGGQYGSKVLTIQLGPSEHLIKVSGTLGSYHAVNNMITSLNFVTNVDSYGPSGAVGGDPFEVRVQTNSSIVGFFGRAGVFLDAIGFYVRPL